MSVPTLTPEAGLIHVQRSISHLLNEVADHFKGTPLITLVVRNPDAEASGGDADFVMTNDNLEQAILALQRRDANGIRSPAPNTPTKEP